MSENTNNLRAIAEEIGRSIAHEIIDQLNRGERPLAPEYLTALQVSQLTGFSSKALEAMRSRREGPPFLQVGRSIRYRTADVRAWIEGGAS